MTLAQALEQLGWSAELIAQFTTGSAIPNVDDVSYEFEIEPESDGASEISIRVDNPALSRLQIN
jgi:hypothetical protein